MGTNPNTDDPSTGTVTQINIPTFPSNATSITVNGTTYTASSPIWTTGGITIPYTDGVGPDQTVTVDPIDGATSVVIPIVAIDNAGVKDPTAGSITLPFTEPLTLKGTVYHDITGLTDNVVTDGTGLGNPSSTPLYANLLSADGATVIASVLVNANGTYELPVAANTTYIVQITTNQGTPNQPTPETALPTSWVNTGDVNPTDPTAVAATPGLSAPVEVVTSNVVEVDFGIQQAPETAVNLQPSQVNPGSTTSVTVPTSAFQTSNVGTNPNTDDPSTGTVTQINIPTFPSNATSITVNGTTYTASSPIWTTGGITIPYTDGVGPDQTVTVDPIDGATSVVIPIVAIDNAGVKDPTAGSITLPFTEPLTLKGTVYHDITGLTDNVVTDGTGLGNPSSTPLYANLLSADGATVIATVLVNANGTYELPVAANTTYIVQITTNQGIVNDPTPATVLPTSWVNTGDVNPTDPTAVAATPGLSAPVEVVTSNVVEVDFGIQQGPETAVNEQSIQNNPGGVISVTVPQDAFQTSNVGMNPNTDDPSTGTVTSINIPTFPSNATSITIGTNTYTSGTWPMGGVTIPYTDGVGPNETIKVDPIDGAVSVVIPIISIDNTGVKDPTDGSVTLPFDAALPITLQSFSAKQIDNSIFLVWKTANESNFSHFEVEKSLNSKEFGSVSKVLGNKASIYNSIDTEPTEGNNYYRLKMVDNDGSFKKSNIISVNFVSNDEFVAVENPANNGKFTVYTNLNDANFKLVNSLGNAIEIKTVKLNNNQFSIEPRNANAGMYYLIINSKGKVTSKKVLIP